MAITDDTHETLEPKDFDEEIQGHGIDVTLRKGIKCPCASKETRQPDASCNLCEGWGFIYSTGSTVRTFGPNRRINRLYEEPGSIDQGDGYFTFQAGAFIQPGDRFVLPIENIVYSEIFTKGEVNVLTGATKEKSRFITINVVEDAVWVKRSPATGAPYVYTKHVLTEGVDFQIINGNTVSWLGGGNPPDTGAQYTIRFRTHGEYMCWGPRTRAEGAVNFPYQYLCKRLDFIKAPQ